jgi:hypothetical protein
MSRNCPDKGKFQVRSLITELTDDKKEGTGGNTEEGGFLNDSAAIAARLSRKQTKHVTLPNSYAALEMYDHSKYQIPDSTDVSQLLLSMGDETINDLCKLSLNE